MKKLLEPGSLVYRFIMFWVILFLRIWMSTVRTRYKNRELLEKTFSSEDPLIVTYWHNRAIAVPFLIPKKYRLKTTAMVSRSRDGQILADILKPWDIRTIRGSASKKNKDKGGASALRASLNVLKEKNSILALTPDGPRGPVYQSQPGAIILAAYSKCPIYPLGIRYGWHFCLPSWDRLKFPLPFSSVCLELGEPLLLEKEHVKDEDLREKACLELNEKITQIS